MELTHKNKKNTHDNHYISDDILFNEIFTKLPEKSVTRFKCVSKSWCDTISNPNFHKLYFQRQPYKYGVLVQADSSYTIRNYASYEPGTENNEVKKVRLNLPKSKIPPQSCNGLVCLVPDADHMCVINPVTQKRRDIALPNNVNVSHCLWAFGYAPSLNNYKIAIIKVRNAKVHVFDLKGSEWRNCNISPRLESYSSSDSESGIVLANGKSHWLLKRHNNNRCTTARIITFDLAEETFDEVPLPEYLNGDDARILRANACLGSICENLCIASDGFDKLLHVWLLRRCGDSTSWTKFMNLNNAMTPETSKIRGFTAGGLGLCGKIMMHLNGQVFLIYLGNHKPKIALLGCHTFHMTRFTETIESPFKRCGDT